MTLPFWAGGGGDDILQEVLLCDFVVLPEKSVRYFAGGVGVRLDVWGTRPWP